MKLLTVLQRLGSAFNRLLDRWDEYDKERKRLRREERRASVQEDPQKAFADLFGESDSMSERTQPEQQGGGVRPHAAPSSMDQGQ